MKNSMSKGLLFLSFLVVAGTVGDADYYTEIGYDYPITETLLALAFAAVIAIIAALIYLWRKR